MPGDGLMMVASCSKGITATVVAMLVERGLLDPGERVAAYRSEFAANGQEQATIEMVAAQIVGLPYPPLGTGLQGLDEHRGEAVTKALAAAPPLWAPALRQQFLGQNLTNWVQGTRAREDDRRTNGDRNCETASALSAFDKRNWASDAPAGTATTSTGSEIMIVGDFGTGYTIVDRIAMTMEIVQHFVWAD